VGLIAQAGAYACYVGLLFTLPLQYTIGAVAFRDCFGVPGARSFSNKPTEQQDYGSPPVLPSYSPQSWQAPGTNAPSSQSSMGSTSYSPPPPPPQSPWNAPAPPAPPSAPPPSAVEPSTQSPSGSGQPSPPMNRPASETPAQIVCPSCLAV